MKGWSIWEKNVFPPEAAKAGAPVESNMAVELPLMGEQPPVVEVVGSQVRAMTLRVPSLTNAFASKRRVEQAIRRGLVRLEGGPEAGPGFVTS